MNIDNTYNIHKILNCIFPHFKSKRLCKKGKHNYQMIAFKKNDYKLKWRCYCCGKEIDFIDKVSDDND